MCPLTDGMNKIRKEIPTYLLLLPEQESQGKRMGGGALLHKCLQYP